MSGLWARYNSMLDAQPLLTKALTSLTGFTAGDILAQCFVEPADKPYDVMRTIRLGSFGFLIHGTTGHYFYGMLDSKLPGTAPLTVASKVLIDQTIWNPIFGCMFFGYLNVMEGKTFADLQKKLNADLKTAVMGSWAVWVSSYLSSHAFDASIAMPHPSLMLFSTGTGPHSELCLHSSQPTFALHQQYPDRIQRLLVLPG
jgi:protein Mpv17